MQTTAGARYLAHEAHELTAAEPVEVEVIPVAPTGPLIERLDAQSLAEVAVVMGTTAQGLIARYA